MDVATPALRAGERLWQAPFRRRPVGRAALLSLGLHLTVLALLIVQVSQRPHDGLPPPSTVDLVFGDGPGDQPFAKPQEAAAPPPQSVPPVEPLPTPPAPPQTAVVTVPPPEPPPPVAMVPAPPSPTPASPPDAGELPVPPPLPPVAMVQPPPIPSPPQRPVPAQRPSPPVATPPRPAPARPPDAFPTPMSFSLNGAAPTASSPQAQSPGRHGRKTLDISLSTRLDESGTTLNGRGGADWGNDLIAWVNRHKYYPPQAAMNGEDGEVMVRVKVNPNGRVTDVELRRRSGSRWLDMALVSLFQDATVPPPPDKSEPTILNFTMNYILIRR